MDSSMAVFSTLGSPFLKESCSRSHYHPSQAHPLKQEQRYTALSPSRLQRTKCPTSPKKAETQSPPPLSSLPGSSYQEVKPPESDSTSPYNESWPSTERSSSSLTPEGTKSLPSEQISGSKTLASPKPPDSVSDSDSVIARYIERFRYGQPTNRRERWAPNGHSAQFWWLGHSFSPESNISKEEASPASDSSHSEVRQSLFSPALDQSPSGDSQDASTLDPETAKLQERAARLLHRSTSPLSSSRNVGSEGLSSTPMSTITNADTNMAGCAPHHLGIGELQGSLNAFPYHINQRFQSGSSSKPEDDILFQWRLRRKMEEASKTVAVMPPLAWRSPHIHLSCTSSLVEGAAPKPSEPASWRSKGGKVQPTSEVQLHVKSTLRDYHPCCPTDSVRNEPSSTQLIEATPFSREMALVQSSESKAEQGLKEATPQEDPIPAYPDSLSLPRPAGTSKLLQSRQAAQPVERVHTEPRGNQKMFRTKQGQAKPSRDCQGPPVSPTKDSLQHVLGEVIAERLFSPPDSPGPHRDKPRRKSKSRILDEVRPRAAVSAPSHPQLLNMAAQLLEQAEDSDGTEFEDDSLLQVLRNQRELLRSQLRAVDVRVSQLEGYHSNQDLSHR